MANDQQRDQDVVTYEKFAGLRNDVDPERFELPDLAVATNIDLDKSGRISRRDGYTKQVTGAVHSLWANGDTCLYVIGASLRQLATDYSSVLVRSNMTPNLPVSYEMVGDRIYFLNGVDTGVVERGVARSWGLVPPPLPNVVMGVGDMPAGQYQYVATQVRSDGQESGARLAGSIVVMDGAGLIFTPSAPTDHDVVATNIYLTAPNGDVLYLALVVPAATVSATYSNDTKELNLPLETQFLSPPPAGHLAKYFRGRLFIAVGDLICPSEEYAYEQFDRRKYFQVDGRVTMMATIEDKDQGGASSGFFIGTDRSCGIMVETSPGEFQYVPKTDYGAVQGAIDYVDGSLFGDNSAGARQLPMFVTTSGICIGMPNLEIKNLTRTKYSFTAAGQGAAIFEPGPNRFIAVTNQ